MTKKQSKEDLVNDKILEKELELLIDNDNNKKLIILKELISLYSYISNIAKLKSISSEWLKIAYKHYNNTKEETLLNNIYNMHKFRATKPLFLLDDFIIAMEWKREYHTKFYMTRRNILLPIVEKIQEFIDSKDKSILVLCQPPSTGKTTLEALLIVSIFGRNPLGSSIFITHTRKMSRKMYDRVIDFLTQELYTYNDIFPHIIKNDRTRADDLFIYTSQISNEPSLALASKESAIAGVLRATDYIFIDDLISGSEEANNADRLDKVRTVLTDDVLQRQSNSDVKIVIISTRWAERDHIGLIEELVENGTIEKNKVTFLYQSALNEETGESNFNFTYEKIALTTDFYNKMRKITDEVTFDTLYQQKRKSRSGYLFSSMYLSYYDTLPEEGLEMKIAFCDVAYGGNDYLSMPIGFQYDEKVYIEDVIYLNGDDKETKPHVIDIIVRYGVQYIVFEANNGGDLYADYIREELKKQNYICTILSVRNTMVSKRGRILQVQSSILKDTYYKDKAPNQQYQKFMKNLTDFNQNMKNKNDDAVDSMSGLWLHCVQSSQSSIQILDRKLYGL